MRIDSGLTLSAQITPEPAGDSEKSKTKQKYMSYHSGLSTLCVTIRYLIIQEPIVGCYPQIVGRYHLAVGRYRTLNTKT